MVLAHSSAMKSGNPDLPIHGQHCWASREYQYASGVANSMVSFSKDALGREHNLDQCALAGL